MSFEIYSIAKTALGRGPKVHVTLIGVAVVIICLLSTYLLVSYQNYMGVDFNEEINFLFEPDKAEIRLFRQTLKESTDEELTLGKFKSIRFKKHVLIRARVRVGEDLELKSKKYYRALVKELFLQVFPEYNAMISVRQGKKRVVRVLIIREDITPEMIKKEMEEFKKVFRG